MLLIGVMSPCTKHYFFTFLYVCICWFSYNSNMDFIPRLELPFVIQLWGKQGYIKYWKCLAVQSCHLVICACKSLYLQICISHVCKSLYLQIGVSPCSISTWYRRHNSVCASINMAVCCLCQPDWGEITKKVAVWEKERERSYCPSGVFNDYLTIAVECFFIVWTDRETGLHGGDPPVLHSYIFVTYCVQLNKTSLSVLLALFWLFLVKEEYDSLAYPSSITSKP